MMDVDHPATGQMHLILCSEVNARTDHNLVGHSFCVHRIHDNNSVRPSAIQAELSSSQPKHKIWTQILFRKLFRRLWFMMCHLFNSIRSSIRFGAWLVLGAHVFHHIFCSPNAIWRKRLEQCHFGILVIESRTHMHSHPDQHSAWVDAVYQCVAFTKRWHLLLPRMKMVATEMHWHCCVCVDADGGRVTFSSKFHTFAYGWFSNTVDSDVRVGWRARAHREIIKQHLSVDASPSLVVRPAHHPQNDKFNSAGTNFN